MQRVGEITAVGNGEVEVTFCHSQDCGSCHACEGGQDRMALRFRSLEGTEPRVGDYAAVELPTGTVVKASLLAYALPLAGLLGGMALGALLQTDRPVLSALLGMIGLLVCVGILALTERRRRASASWQPSLLKIYPREMYTGKKTALPPA